MFTDYECPLYHEVSLKSQNTIETTAQKHSGDQLTD